MTSAVAQRPELVDRAFRAMGCDVRVTAVAQGRPAGDLADAAARAEAFVHAAAARLTRFDATSELRQLGAASPGSFAASPLLAHAVEVALHAAEASGGLLDPTLVAPLERSGYPSTWRPERRLPLDVVLAAAPARRPARPAPDAAWRGVTVDRRAGAVTRDRTLALDLGATAKGLIADLALRMLGDVDAGYVDAGGDLAIAGNGLALFAADPFERTQVSLEATGACGVATSSIAGRCWMGPDGHPAHHLLDPSTGRAAFTGVVQATAAAPTAAEAERLAGHALLSGPAEAPALLAPYGGVLVLDDTTTIRLPGALLQ